MKHDFGSTGHISRNLSHFRETTLQKGVYACPRYPAQIHLRLIRSRFQSVRPFPFLSLWHKPGQEKQQSAKKEGCEPATHADLKMATMR